jgi:hypothetical protein
MKGRPALAGIRLKTESCKAAIDTVALRLIGDTASRNDVRLHCTPTARLASPHSTRCDFAKCGCTVPANTGCPPSSHFFIVIWFEKLLWRN